ncbi:uncharacterized protein LOC127287824 [Leptopilina boulardi]|uniref:uncharacterized protein LOC127276776 n=1 Tax=Leptopilina boulardi TaxID=63433 RepID=UPI0021F5E4A3|nr:uncharacterized protein LOC127276776 [Leptopilina boulardi]XP_051170898.1 uncharacterized protein LOC127287822 [Leptopilina boulardi]XP_051170901.1 uncharacterized protein LOC127287824 [Leptopilina boulardi]
MFFQDVESIKFRENLVENKENKRRGLTIKARGRQVIPIEVSNDEVKEGYLPLIKTDDGIIIGEGIVSNNNGLCHIFAINTTLEDVEIEIPPQELIPFEYYPLPGEETDEESSDEDYEQPIDRISAIINNLRLDHLNAEEQEHVKDIVREFPESFHLTGEPLNPTNKVKHKIITIDEIPIHTRPYRFSPAQKEEIDKVIDRMTSEGAIKPSSSPYNSPLLIIPKKIDGTGKKKWRIVIDFRALNEKTVGDFYPLPHITSVIDSLGQAQYFSVFDLASGFHQIELDPDDRQKTAFSTVHGHYEYVRMPMGLKNSPATFQRLMDQVLLGLQGVELFVYLDDIVIHAENLQEHGTKVKRLLQRLKEANLTLQPEKCEFLCREVAYLGHIISSDGVKPNPKKIEAVEHFPTPKTPRNVKQFLGLAGYYRRFIKDFSAKAKPLSNLLKKNVKFEWGPEQDESFKELRSNLCKSPILQYPDYDKIFTITTDASDFAIGAVLSQDKDGIDLPIAYLSRVLNTPEQNYSTTEKECLAVLYAVNHFRPYIYGKKFILVSDHEPLKWINSIKDPGQRLVRWRLRLRDYEYEFNYKPGKLNHNADALSRNPIESIPEESNARKQARILIQTRQSKNSQIPTAPSTSSGVASTSTQKKRNLRQPTKIKSIIKPTKKLATDTKILEKSTIGQRVSQRNKTQPRSTKTKVIDNTSSSSDSDENEKPPICKKSTSVLPSLIIPTPLYDPYAPKSAPPIAPFEHHELIVEPITANKEIVKIVSPPISGSEDSSSEEDHQTPISRKEIGKELEKSIALFDESIARHEDWLMEKELPPRDWRNASVGDDDPEIHEAANEYISGNHSEFAEKLNEILKNAHKDIQELTDMIQSIENENETEKKQTTENVNKGKNVTFVDQPKRSITPLSFDRPLAISTPFTHPTIPEETSSSEEENTDDQSTINESVKEQTTKSKIKTSIDSIPPDISNTMANKLESSTSNILSCRENLTYYRSNYVHFLSADCEFITPIGRLLIDIGAIDPQEIKLKKPQKGQILITPRGQYNIYTLIIKHNHFDPLLKDDVSNALQNLKFILQQENSKELRISRRNDLTDELMRGGLIQILNTIFQNSNIKVTVCYGQVTIPKEEIREDIIKEYHNSKIGGHKGVTKTYRRIREKFFWPGIKDQVTEFVRKCPTCQEQKLVRVRTREPMLITDTPLDVFDKVSLDTVGKLPTTPDGNCHILTMQDHLSKYCMAVAIPDVSTTTIAHAVAAELFSKYGAPKTILTDKGGGFISKLMRKLSKIFGVQQVTTSGYRPQTNGSLERSHIVLIDFLKQYSKNYDDWDKLLPFCMFAYNTSVHEATNFTPFELVFGKTARTPSSFPPEEKLETYGSYLVELISRLTEIKNMAAKNLIQSKLNSKENYDRKLKPFLGKIGDKAYVLREVKKSKFEPYYHGPYEIVDILDKHTAILITNEGQRFQKHIDKLKLAYE